MSSHKVTFSQKIVLGNPEAIWMECWPEISIPSFTRVETNAPARDFATVSVLLSGLESIPIHRDALDNFQVRCVLPRRVKFFLVGYYNGYVPSGFTPGSIITFTVTFNVPSYVDANSQAHAQQHIKRLDSDLEAAQELIDKKDKDLKELEALLVNNRTEANTHVLGMACDAIAEFAFANPDIIKYYTNLAGEVQRKGLEQCQRQFVDKLKRIIMAM